MNGRVAPPVGHPTADTARGKQGRTTDLEGDPGGRSFTDAREPGALIGFPAHVSAACWRRGGDSNPRDGYPPNSFRDCRIQPLCHLSARWRARGWAGTADAVYRAGAQRGNRERRCSYAVRTDVLALDNRARYSRRDFETPPKGRAWF
jgi:hypothetical protein